MASRKPRVKDTANRFQRYAAAYITKHLQQVANEHEIDVAKVVSDKLKETYIANVKASYAPRSPGEMKKASYNRRKEREELEDRKQGITSRRSRKTLSYHHTDTFVDSIDTVIEGQTVKVIIKPNKYEDPTGKNRFERTAVDVYKYLTNGTTGGGMYPAWVDDDGKVRYAENYPTQAHLFEMHTYHQMVGFMHSLEGRIKRRRVPQKKKI